MIRTTTRQFGAYDGHIRTLETSYVAIQWRITTSQFQEDYSESKGFLRASQSLSCRHNPSRRQSRCLDLARFCIYKT